MKLKFESVEIGIDDLLHEAERVLRARVRGGWIYHFSRGDAISTTFVPDPRPQDSVIVPHALGDLPEELWHDELPHGEA